MRRLLYTMLLLIPLWVMAQPGIPVNGPANPLPDATALVHATVYVDYQTKIDNAILIIRDGKIEQVGAAIALPAGVRIIECKGMTIYPAFIDLYSDYGISYKPEKREIEQPQVTSSKPGAYSWNEAIHPETDAATLFRYDDARSKTLREAGFASVATGLQDGIMRGAMAMVHTRNGREQEVIFAPGISSGLSFSKGTSSQPYPSSLTGTIALIRQSYYDAIWYKSQQKEINYSWQALQLQMTQTALFALDNKLDIMRVANIAKEFGLKYIVRGAGDEYQRLNEIKETGFPLILPLNFPKPYEVENPFVTDRISTADMKHWELAPTNPAAVFNAGIPFAFTMKGCDQAADFLKQLRKAVEAGLAEKEALKALTQTPAQLLGLDKKIGSLKAGMYADLIICNGNLFDKQTQLHECWSEGQRYIIQPMPDLMVQGDYALSNLNFRVMRIQGSGNNLSVTLFGKDTIKGSIHAESGIYTCLFQQKNKPIVVSFWIKEKDASRFPAAVKNIYGTISDSLQYSHLAFQGSRTADAPTEPMKKEGAKAKPAAVVTWPFTDYGWRTQPKAEKVLFKKVTIWTNEADSILDDADLIIEQGKIKSIGRNLSCVDCKVISFPEKTWLTNGIIDEHSHIALTRGVNEGTQAVTAEVRMGDVINSEDINIYRQLSGGVIASQLLHGSANPIGGQSALIKLRWGLSPDKMKIEGADGFIKFALGENVKQSNWGDRAIYRYPQTRMGVEQTDIDAFTRAREYGKDKKNHTDLELETLLEILNKKRFITCHSYVQSEINMLMHVADSFGFNVNTFTHILEGYKVADKMKRHGVGASTFADWWAYKYEVIEAIPYNAALLNQMGVVTAINSDDAEMGRRLNQEAAKTMKYGGVREMDAWKMVTLNPAKLLHLDQHMGSIKPGKDADLVLWSNNPLSIYAKALYTFVDGVCYYDASTIQKNLDEITAERKRLIQRMIEEKANGEKTEKKVSIVQDEYHCDTEGDYGN